MVFLQVLLLACMVVDDAHLHHYHLLRIDMVVVAVDYNALKMIRTLSLLDRLVVV